jgi:hypothetical protein
MPGSTVKVADTLVRIAVGDHPQLVGLRRDGHRLGPVQAEGAAAQADRRIARKRHPSCSAAAAAKRKYR